MNQTWNLVPDNQNMERCCTDQRLVPWGRLREDGDPCFDLGSHHAVQGQRRASPPHREAEAQSDELGGV
ncbi:MAG: hypothetical protein QOF70_5222 [Acetobacteraceae bacterium]|nr:hypothetical protein [Acetobacteraceae bacterium]